MAVQMGGPSERELRELSRRDLIEHYEALGTNFEFVSERLAELEIQLEDLGWQKFGVDNDAEFTRPALAKIIRMARVMSIKNPLVRRAVELPTYYVWGQGISVNAKYKQLNDFIQALWDDPSNKADFTSTSAQIANETELRTAGNVFFTLYPDLQTGLVEIRTIPVEQVMDIICNPQDKAEPWYYLRTWTESNFNEFTGQTDTRQRTAYYPDMRYYQRRNFTQNATGFPDAIGGKPVMRSPVYHVKVGGLKGMRFGVPEVYASLDWAQAAKQDLEDYATIRRALARYAWVMTMKGGSKGKVDAAQQRIGQRIDNNNLIDSNPPKAPGATFIAGDGVGLEPMNTRGATPDPDGSRRMWLMVSAAVGLPETMFGDADVGNHATAKTLDRPTELQFSLRRKLWTDVITEMLQFCTDIGIMAAGNDLEGEISKDYFGREILVLPVNAQTGDPESRHIDVAFPEMLEHDVGDQIGAIVDAATLKGHPDSGVMPARTLAQLLLQALGADDIDEILDTLYDEEGNLKNPPPAPVPNPNPAAPGAPPVPAPPPAPRVGNIQNADIYAMVEAVRELAEALKGVADREEEPEPVAA